MTDPLTSLLAERPWLLADGATGSNLFNRGLQSGDAPELWNADRPEDIAWLGRSFIEAGADIILTNSFGGTRYRLKLHKASDRVGELNEKAAAIARGEADRAGRRVLVAGSIGPTGEILEPLGPLSLDDAREAFAEQAAALARGGADVLWIETMSSVEETEAALPPGAWPAWTGSNHDMFRFPTRWAEDDPAKVRLALLMLLSLRGTPVLYQGDEIGMANVAVLHEDMRDPLGVRFYPYYEGRDAGRTPMQWSDGPGGGFTNAVPWLPLGDVAAANVLAQREDPRSVLTLCRGLIAFRREHPEFSMGDTTMLTTAADVWAFTRGERHVVALNMSSESHVLTGLPGTIAVCTDGARELEAVESDLRLAPFEGVILERP